MVIYLTQKATRAAIKMEVKQMKDMFFSIAMLLAGVFCAIVGMEYALVLYLGGLFAVIGVVDALVAEFGGGLVKNPDDEKDYGSQPVD